MKLRFLWIGATKDPDLNRLEEKYFKRVKKHFRAERLFVSELRKSDPRQAAAQMEREASLVERRLHPKTFLTVVDERGQEFSSVELAAFLKNALNGGVHEMTFLTGGFLGIPPRIRDKADQILSLSRLTLPHELARVALLEQIYRAITIFKGLPYHK